MGAPVLFGQERIGKNEKPFKLYKFRSMTNKKDQNGQLLSEDKRLTKAGILLRNSSLDELPELWSILTGKMSFVGPRPMPVYYGPYFLPEERKRHTVRGGLIPPDSLSGKAITTYEEQFEYECGYAQNLSFILDIKVIVTTFKILFLRVKDNYGTCERPHLNIYRKDMNANK
jgi:UDP-galactose phosphate transferase